ncbi:MAG: 30S ribosomal protein S1 [Clostridiales bacterium]|nr:30S ribosomal protein S1 [Clostridiales bacterium]
MSEDMKNTMEDNKEEVVVEVVEEVKEAEDTLEKSQIVENDTKDTKDAESVVPQEEGMMNIMEEIEKSLVQLHQGDIVNGKVISVTDKEIMVNVSYKSDGIIPRNEISNDDYIVPSEIVSEGDEIEVYVIKVNDGEGNVLLSRKRVEMQDNWKELESVCESGEEINVKVIEAVNGGVIALTKGVRGFIPASLLSNTYVDDLKDFIGESFNVQVIELNRRKNRVVLSRKKVLEKEKEALKKETLEKLEKGQRIKGKVRNIVSFGAFVDIGGIDGLIYISELSWSRIKHPSEILNVGDEVEVDIIDIDKSTEKISLSLKQMHPKPWDKIKENYNIGDVITGKVVRIVDFGAFVEVIPGVDGLVHISEISNKYVEKPAKELEVNQEVTAKIIDINVEQKRISLSIAKTLEEEVVEEIEEVKNKVEEKEKPLKVDEKKHVNDHSEITIADIINKSHS